MNVARRLSKGKHMNSYISYSRAGNLLSVNHTSSIFRAASCRKNGGFKEIYDESINHPSSQISIHRRGLMVVWNQLVEQLYQVWEITLCTNVSFIGSIILVRHNISEEIKKCLLCHAYWSESGITRAYERIALTIVDDIIWSILKNWKDAL